MSYDLFFYKKKGTEISKSKISSYLSDNLVSPNVDETQWFFENEDTEVYFSFEYTDEKAIDDLAVVQHFDDTHFSFNLNFLRPSFFGLEAFRFVEQFCNDLDLYVVNPQSESGYPYKPNKQEEFENWNKTNLSASKKHFTEMQSCYLSEETCNSVWQYNYNRQILQQKLSDEYFVPKIFFFKEKNNKPFTLTIWTEHIPIILPTVDYILLTRRYKKYFKTIKDTVLVSRSTFLNAFGGYFEKFDFRDCKIIHKDNANQIKNIFNSIRTEKELGDFADRLSVENLYNAIGE